MISTAANARRNNVEAVDQVLKVISALTVGRDKQNRAVEEPSSSLSDRLDALESNQRDCHVALSTSIRDASNGIHNLF